MATFALKKSAVTAKATRSRSVAVVRAQAYNPKSNKDVGAMLMTGIATASLLAGSVMPAYADMLGSGLSSPYEAGVATEKKGGDLIEGAEQARRNIDRTFKDITRGEGSWLQQSNVVFDDLNMPNLPSPDINLPDVSGGKNIDPYTKQPVSPSKFITYNPLSSGEKVKSDIESSADKAARQAKDWGTSITGQGGNMGGSIEEQIPPFITILPGNVPTATISVPSLPWHKGTISSEAENAARRANDGQARFNDVTPFGKLRT